MTRKIIARSSHKDVFIFCSRSITKKKFFVFAFLSFIFKQCDVGCTLWESALDSSCQRVCVSINNFYFSVNAHRPHQSSHFLIQNKTEINDFDNRQIYCIKGCNEASNFYFQWIKQEVQSPMAPALIPDSLTSTSLSLEWSVPSKFWRWLEIVWEANDLWKFYNSTWKYSSIYKI